MRVSPFHWSSFFQKACRILWAYQRAVNNADGVENLNFAILLTATTAADWLNTLTWKPNMFKNYKCLQLLLQSQVKSELQLFNFMPFPYTMSKTHNTETINRSNRQSEKHQSSCYDAIWETLGPSILNTPHTPKLHYRPSTPPHGSSTPQWQWPSIREMNPATLQEMHRNCPRNVKKSWNWSGLQISRILIKHSWEVPEQVQDMEFPLWIGLGTDSLRHRDRSSGGVLYYLRPRVSSRSFESCGLQGRASMDWTLPGASHRHSVELGLRHLEARSKLGAIRLCPWTIPYQFLWCGNCCCNGAFKWNAYH